MSTKPATAPAWQVRESARQKFLERIKQKIIRGEEDIGMVNFYHALLYLLTDQLTFVKGGGIGNFTPKASPFIIDFYFVISREITDFQRSEEEGNALFAKLLEWAAGEVTWSCHSALETQTPRLLEQIYGVADVTEEVPLE
jgi:hypothetical protein